LKWRVRFSLFIGILLTVCENYFSTPQLQAPVAALRMPTASTMQAKINF
jgi:hypothetical protein